MSDDVMALSPDENRTSCWEFMNCGVDRPCCSIMCPAYPYMGRVCWAVAGTMCGGEVQGEYAKKIEDCSKCHFYHRAIVTKKQ